MASERPQIIGRYQLLGHLENAASTVRILRMEDGSQEVVPHVHNHSTQVYVVLSGKAAIEVDGVEQVIGMNEMVSVPLRSLHRANPVGGPAVVLNISVPPLRADDQAPALEPHEAPDMHLPQEGSDLDD